MKNILYTALLAGMLISCSSDPSIVKIDTGKIKGQPEENVMAFKGIPYMKAERFMPPQKADSWDGVLDCLEYKPWAIQRYDPNNEFFTTMAEDGCTFLNVWTKDTKAKMPVMVWLHGGGFSIGASNGSPFYTGAALADKDVVVVTVNHRLDIMGFLDLSAVDPKYKHSGNVGMLDIVASLEWVQRNIAKFGGDPDNVTIFGESGGGGKVGTLMCMPSADGLFEKAIVMSGTIINQNNTEKTSKLGLEVISQLGLTPETIDKINEISYDDIYAAGTKAVAKLRSEGMSMSGFGPTADGEVLVQQPFSPGFAEFSADVPLIIGSTFNEMERNVYGQEMTLEEAKDRLRPRFGDDTDAYADAFFKAYPDASVQDMVSIDKTFRPKTIITTKVAAAEKPVPVYSYIFKWKSPARNNTAGSAHGFELPFTFNELPVAGFICSDPTEADNQLADRLSSLFVNFAKTGVPSAEGVPAWTPYTEETPAVLYMDHEFTLQDTADDELQEIINRNLFK